MERQMNKLDMILFIIKPLVLGISLAAPVGPIKLEMIRRGIRGGFWPSMFVGLGAVTIDMVLMFLIFLGLAVYLTHSFFSYVLSAAGFLLLARLGIKSMKSALSDENMLDHASETTAEKSSYWTGFSIALANPFIFIFWLGVYGSSLTTLGPGHSFMYLFLFSMLIIAGIILWNINVAMTVHFLRNYLKDWILKAVSFAAGAYLLGYSFYLLSHLFTLLI
ncbi:threonine/homoserine/homoserine lactone efflux protein [Metabacillus sp. SLBN-84]